MYKTAVETHINAAHLPAELAELVDALDSGSSVRKNFRVQVPGSAFEKSIVERLAAVVSRHFLALKAGYESGLYR